jgi:hypothetical protein
MPWRGPEVEGEFPTLGYAVAEALIQDQCAIPDGPRMGQPFVLTDEQLRCCCITTGSTRRPGGSLLPRDAVDAQPEVGQGSVRAAWICAEAHPEGPVLFDGWDAAGEPVGRPWPTPHIQVTAVSRIRPTTCSGRCCR